MRLHLFRGEAALEGALDELVRARSSGPFAVELGRGLTSIPRLVADAGRMQGPALDRSTQLLLVHAAAGALDRWPALAPSLRPVLGRTIAALRRAGVGVAALRQVAPRLPDRAKRDAFELADRLAHYESLLGDRLDEGGFERRALLALARDTVPSLDEVTHVELHAPVPFDVRTRLVVEALTARGLPVRCGVPEVASGVTRWALALTASQSRGLDVLESQGGDLERVNVPLDAGPVPTLGIAASPTLEARLVARVVRDHVASGLAPDEITVAAASDVQRAQLALAIGRYGVPVATPPDRTCAQTSVYRLVAQLLRLADERVPRDGMAALLGSRLIEPVRVEGRIVPSGRVAAILREALPESARPETWETSFSSLARPERRRVELSAVTQHVLGIRDRVLALPDRASLQRHVASLSSLLDALGVRSRIRRQTRGPAPDPKLASGRAQGAEQAALDALDELLEQLPRAARRLRLSDRVYARSELATVLLDAWGNEALRVGGARGAAVTLATLSNVTEGAPLLVLCGQTENALRSSITDPLLADETIATLGRALERPLFEGLLDPAHRERLGLARAMSRSRSVLITTSRTGDDGRVVLPGELVELARARGAVAIDEDALVPLALDARTTVELEARLQLETFAMDRAREGLDLETRNAIEAALPIANARALAQMERDRDAYFAGEREAGDHDGLLTDARSLVQPGSSEAPLSASTLRAYSECPQRYFLDSVLRVRPSDEASDELDDRARGALAHKALEILFTRWRDAGLLPLRGIEEERAHLEPALQAAVEIWRNEHGVGDELVFAQRERALSRLLADVWKHEVEEKRVMVPSHFEWKFDGVEVDGVFLKGSIDRIDLAPDSAAVFDYKSGRLDQPKKDLKEDTFGDTSWQLPLYAATVREKLGVDAVKMVFFSLRELKSAPADAPAWLRFDAALRDKLKAQVTRMRSGDFTVSPRADACKMCHLEAACRIVERQDDDEETP